MIKICHLHPNREMDPVMGARQRLLGNSSSAHTDRDTPTPTEQQPAQSGCESHVVMVKCISSTEN